MGVGFRWFSLLLSWVIHPRPLPPHVHSLFSLGRSSRVVAAGRGRALHIAPRASLESQEDGKAELRTWCPSMLGPNSGGVLKPPSRSPTSSPPSSPLPSPPLTSSPLPFDSSFLPSSEQNHHSLFGEVSWRKEEEGEGGSPEGLPQGRGEGREAPRGRERGRGEEGGAKGGGLVGWGLVRRGLVGERPVGWREAATFRVFFSPRLKTMAHQFGRVGSMGSLCETLVGREIVAEGPSCGGHGRRIQWEEGSFKVGEDFEWRRRESHTPLRADSPSVKIQHLSKQHTTTTALEIPALRGLCRRPRPDAFIAVRLNPRPRQNQPRASSQMTELHRHAVVCGAAPGSNE